MKKVLCFSVSLATFLGVQAQTNFKCSTAEVCKWMEGSGKYDSCVNQNADVVFKVSADNKKLEQTTNGEKSVLNLSLAHYDNVRKTWDYDAVNAKGEKLKVRFEMLNKVVLVHRLYDNFPLVQLKFNADKIWQGD